MAHNQPYPAEQRTNLIGGLQDTLRRVAEEEDLTSEQAFVRVALDSMGFDFDETQLSDGRGDFGVDYWVVDDRSATVMQFKSHEFEGVIDAALTVGPSILTDLPRIMGLLEALDHVPSEANVKTKTFLKDLRSAIYRLNPEAGNDGPTYSVSIYFVCLAGKLTAQANQELAALQKKTKVVWGGRPIEITVTPVLLDDLLAEYWRERNVDWRTSDGTKDDKIEFLVSGQMLESPKSLVFFTKASQVVDAYDKFGYQIFEPNVRCELKRSRVNEAIKASVHASRGRKEFKHLNNGITLICSSFHKVKRGDQHFVRVRQPGVINGLQTVKSIHDAFEDLDAKEKDDFSDKCELLVRIHTRDAVSDYRELVKSTNNQNPMQPRNLRSNDPEQLQYERLFAGLKWFYERKEGAWQAFRSDSNLWGSLRGLKPGDFRPQNGQTRSIDNLEMSQAWLSFLGFSDEAIHNKKDIFSDEKYYDLVFKKRITKHGFDYNLSFGDSAIRSEAVDQAPSPHGLLLAYLLREWADGLTPSRRQNRDDSIKRLKLEKFKKEEQDAKLSEDAPYIRGLVLAGAKYLFSEFCGLILFRSLGREVHDKFSQVLVTKSIKSMAENRDIEPARILILHDDYKSDDIVPVLWALYLYCLDNIIGLSNWRQQFEQAAVRSRFNYSDFNRRMLFGQLENLDKVYQKRAVPTAWSEGMEKHKGIFNYVRATFK